MAPDPQYKSATTRSTTPPRLSIMEKIASRAKSVVGRTPGGNFALRARPRAAPPMILTASGYVMGLGLEQEVGLVVADEESDLLNEFGHVLQTLAEPCGHVARGDQEILVGAQSRQT